MDTNTIIEFACICGIVFTLVDGLSYFTSRLIERAFYKFKNSKIPKENEEPKENQ